MTERDADEFDTDEQDEELTECRLRELYVDCDLTVSQTATRLSRNTGEVLEALRRTDFYEPKTATKIAELDPEDVFDDCSADGSGRRV